MKLKVPLSTVYYPHDSLKSVKDLCSKRRILFSSFSGAERMKQCDIFACFSLQYLLSIHGLLSVA